MADAVTSQIIFDGQHKTIVKFTSVSDGTGEAAVLKVDVSTLTPPATAVKIRKAWYDVSFGMSVSILWDATTDVPALILAGFGCHDFTCFSGIPNNAGAGKTGDIRFTTNGASADDTYSIVLELVKDFD